MHTTQTHTRVRYAETDQMGYVYYGNYAQYFEIGRVEALRTLGYTYKQLEESGIMMPVAHMEVNYHKPATYDALLTITTIVSELPTAKMQFDYEIRNEAGVLLTSGKTTLVFINRNTQRITRCPDFLTQALQPYFETH